MTHECLFTAGERAGQGPRLHRGGVMTNHPCPFDAGTLLALGGE